MRTNLAYMVESQPLRNRNPYQSTALSLMHDGVLNALHGLLLERKWSSITMADVATAAGISRGTLYNEFRSRRGLARSYALRLTDIIVTGMRTAINDHHQDGYGAMRTVFRQFFDRVHNDPLAQVLPTENAPNDILRLITVDSQFLVDHAVEQLSATLPAQLGERQPVRRRSDGPGRGSVRAQLSRPTAERFRRRRTGDGPPPRALHRSHQHPELIRPHRAVCAVRAVCAMGILLDDELQLSWGRTAVATSSSCAMSEMSSSHA